MRRDDSDRLFDKRVFRRNISAGRISKDDHRRFLEALPDVSDKIKPTDEGGDDDGFDGSSAHERDHARPNPSPFAALGARPYQAGDDDDDDLDDEDDDFDDEDDDDDDDDDDVVDAPGSEEPPPSDDGG